MLSKAISRIGPSVMATQVVQSANANSFTKGKLTDKNSEAVGKKQSEVLSKAHQLCREYLHGAWAKVSIEEIEVTPLGGGLTNKLYICKLPEKLAVEAEEEKRPHTVLLRVYGLILQDFKAQIQESVVYSILAERGVGPQLFAVFPGGRLEEYVPCRTLTTGDLSIPSTSENIARCLSDYHTLSMPVKKEPTFVTSKLTSYLHACSETSFQDEKNQRLFDEIKKFQLDELAEFVTELISKDDPVVVFCHNDVQEGNLLETNRSDRSNPIQMIDFEYSAYNYRGFDIANHFCEWMYDYSHSEWPFYSYKPQNYPDHNQQVKFVQSYLANMFRHNPHLTSDPKWQLDVILEEVRRFAMLSHLFWALWSVVQANMSDIGFGYLQYAITRLESLKLQRKEWNL